MPDLVSYSFLGWVTDTNLKIIFSSIIILLLVTVVAIGVDYLIRKTIVTNINNSFKRSRLLLLQLINENHVLDSLALLVFGLVFVFGSFLLASNTKPLSVAIATVTLKTANLFNLYILTVSINRFIYALHEFYQRTSSRDDKLSWHSYIKIFSFFIWLLVAILAAAYIFGQAPTAILTGLGALSAIVLLIFRDTFLGIVSSIQANASSMVRIGDWISIDKYSIDGIVEEISINSVRIRNSDNTITTIPTYNLTTEAVKNWEFMLGSEGRRFKHSILIDPTSISFLDKTKLATMIAGDAQLQEALYELHSNLNQVTNLTLFRVFLQCHLINHPALNQEYQNIVKVLTASIDGLPLEITGFSIETSTYAHEIVKAGIIEFAYANLNRFALQVAKSN